MTRLVLVHGFTQTGRSWDGVARALAAAWRAEVLAPDLPGHGGAGARRPSGLAEAATALGQEAGNGVYLGYSMGARVCLRLALDCPATVERLVLVGATAGLADEPERAARRAADEALAARIERARLDDFVEEWLRGPLFAHLTPEQAGRAARLENTSRGLAFALRCLGTGAEPSMWPRLAELTMPVLVVAGEHDDKFARLAGEMAARIGAGAHVELLAGAGHAAPFEQPEAFAELVAGWLGPPGSPARRNSSPR